MSRQDFEEMRKKCGDNGASEESQPELTDEQLKELDKAQLERYRLKDRPFPAPMSKEAFYGIAGDIVRIIEPTSEASREAIFAQLLVGLGNRSAKHPLVAKVLHGKRRKTYSGESAKFGSLLARAMVFNLAKRLFIVCAIRYMD